MKTKDNTIATLVAALEAALPSLERLATEEARANLAPTGIKRTAARECMENARRALACAKEPETGDPQ